MVDPVMDAIARTRAHLISLRGSHGHWEGELSSSALSTATAVVAVSLVDERAHDTLIARGARWLVEHQNADGGWGDTTISKSNLSTTLLCWSALSLVARHGTNRCPDEAANSSAPAPTPASTFARCEAWIRDRVGSLEPDEIRKAVIARYGKDRTFSVPILMTCAIGGRLGPHDEAWRRVLALPFELAAFPRSWFGAIGLPVVSYALPALIAIGHARFYHAPPAWWNPLGWLRKGLWPRIRPMLKELQPSSGGYLEATPLTSFVTMALASAGEKDHPTVADAVRFLIASQREDGSWAIDTNLATWATTLSVKAICAARHSDVEGMGACDLDIGMSSGLREWLLNQQYKTIHPFTNAAPGGWAWTDLPGGVPDADDTCGALIALWHLSESEDERRSILPAIEAGITWLLDLQNRDGGIPTFCRGWGALPFDRSTPELTAHAMLAWSLWHDFIDEKIRVRALNASRHARMYLRAHQRADGSWVPLWFGNEHAEQEENPVYGTAQVAACLSRCGSPARQDETMIKRGLRYLLQAQRPDGCWGGDTNAPSSIEETALAVTALARFVNRCQLDATVDRDVEKFKASLARGVHRLIDLTQAGAHFPPAPIGLYFARLWYHEKTYPVLWTLGALSEAKAVLGAEFRDAVQ